ncbi:hypothetical protein D3C86_2184410 [compost metagenome]
MTDQMTIEPVATLPTRASGGQLCVYEMASPGRLVTVAQVAQKKKAFIMRWRSGSLIVLVAIA